MGHFVNAPLVIARQENGTQVYLYAGVPVPSSVKASEIERLKADGLIAADGDEQGASGSPAKSATKDEWVAYAQSQGDQAAADKTKEQLIADHGGN